VSDEGVCGGPDPTVKYVVCTSCGFAGTVAHWDDQCPDCKQFHLKVMTADERDGYCAGTFTHYDYCFDDLCSYTGVYGDMRRAAMRKEE
jgi:hypothetical protein